MKKHPDQLRYVSRGGLKLEEAVRAFAVDIRDKICIDVGASTGGFTDCLLQHGAKKIYAVDVAYGQFDWKLRNDPRVVMIERQNIRHLSQEKIPDKIEIAVIDVVFISLKTVLPAVQKFLAPRAEIVALIKPQFEVRKEEVGPKGVVKDSKLHDAVVAEIKTAGENLGWQCQGVVPSPILGREGNREFLMCFGSSLST